MEAPEDEFETIVRELNKVPLPPDVEGTIADIEEDKEAAWSRIKQHNERKQAAMERIWAHGINSLRDSLPASTLAASVRPGL